MYGDLVRPLSGPVDGGTSLTIEGSNLAMGMEQLVGRVMVGDRVCLVIDYQVVLCSTILYCIALYCTVLYFTVLFFTLMYCNII